MKLNQKPYNKKILKYKLDHSKSFKVEKNKNILNNENKENIEINKNIQSDKEDLIPPELFLDEKRLKEDYDIIEKELKKLRKNNLNENDYKDNKKNSGSFLNNNSKIEGDLFYYSDEDDDKNNNKITKINKEDKKKNENNLSEINVKNIKEVINEQEFKNSNNNETKDNIQVNNRKEVKLNKINFEKIEYGINEDGNPIILENINKKISNNNKLIAYIISSGEKNENYLIDINGDKIQRLNNNDFYYLYNDKKIIIKNFDVQNPKLRIYGTNLRYSSLCSELDKQVKNLDISYNIINNTKNDNNLKKKDKFYYINNTKDILYQKKNYNKSILANKSCKIFTRNTKNTNDIIKETKLFFDKNENGTLIKKNINKVKNILSLRNIYLNNYIINSENNDDSFSLKNKLNNKLKLNSSKCRLMNNPKLNSNYRYNTSNNNSFNFYKENIPSLNESNSKILISYFGIKKNNSLLESIKKPGNNLNNTTKEIEFNLKKIKMDINKNKTLNKNFSQSDNNISLKLYNSFNRLKNNLINGFYINTNYNQYKTNRNQNTNKKKLERIVLDKKHKMAITPEKTYRNAVLSKKANDIIKDYANKSLTKRNNEYIKKMNIEEYTKNKEKKNKKLINKSLINKLRNSLNNKSTKKQYKIKYKDDKKMNKKEKITLNNINKSNKELKCKINLNANSILKKLFEKSKNINKNASENKFKLVPIQNNLNINIYENAANSYINKNLIYKINKSFQQNSNNEIKLF